MNQRVQIPMLIGITHSDCPGACATDEIMARLGFMNDKNRPPVLKVNPTERGSVVEAVMGSMALLVAQQNVPQSTNKGESQCIVSG
jgi:signal recognition particle receptor subunit beta